MRLCLECRWLFERAIVVGGGGRGKEEKGKRKEEKRKEKEGKRLRENRGLVTIYNSLRLPFLFSTLMYKYTAITTVITVALAFATER